MLSGDDHKVSLLDHSSVAPLGAELVGRTAKSFGAGTCMGADFFGADPPRILADVGPLCPSESNPSSQQPSAPRWHAPKASQNGF